MARHDKEGSKRPHGKGSSHHEGESMNPKSEKATSAGGTMERLKTRVSEASGAMEDVLESEPVRNTIERGGRVLKDAGEMISDSGRNVMDAGRSLMSGLADISVLFGLAAGLGVWYFVHESSDANAGDVEIKTTGAVGRVQEGAGQLVDSLTESASSLSSSAVQKLQGVVAEVQGAVDRNPWVFVTGGLLVGSLLAVLLPQTESENRALGQMRDEVVDRAQEQVQDTLQSGMVRAAVDVMKGGFSG